MRSMWSVRISAVLALSLLPVVGSKALANGHYTRNYVVTPTSYVEAYPTAYFQVLPTSYYLPTEYVVATPMSYVVPMSWSVPVVATRYVQRPVYAYPTTYVTPATWIYPTTWIYPAVYRDAEVDLCCTTTPAPFATQTMPMPTSTLRVAPKAPAADPSRSTPTPTPSTVDSVPMEPTGAGNSALVEKKAEPVATSDGTTKRETVAPPPVVSSNVTPIDPGLPTPPVAPAPEKESPTTGTPITPAPGSPTNAKPPVAPGEEPITLPNIGGDAVKRESMKPVTPAATLSRYLRTTKKGDLNVLEGRVISSETGLAQDGVSLMIASRSGNIADQEVVTDAAGHYSVRLPDGQWIVRMKMPSGKIYALSQLVVKSGQIHDDLDRDIPTLNISR